MTHWSRAHIGAPFEAVGFCWGFVRRIYLAEFGIDLPAYAGDVGRAEREEAEALFRGEFGSGPWREIAPGEERPLDVVWTKHPRHRLATHAGVVVRPGLMIHADEGGVTCTEDYTRPAWRRLILGFRRHALAPAALEARHAA